MKKILLILSFILLSVVSFAQRQRTTAMFDADTTTRPKAGFYGIGVKSNNIYFIPPTGNNIRMANYSLFTGLTTNYLSKWNGSKLVNSAIYESGGNVGIGTASPLEKLHVAGAIITTGSISGHGANRATFSQEGANGAFIQSYGINTSTMGSYFFRQASSDFSITNVPFFISTAGSVGISTTSPNASALLDITSTTKGVLLPRMTTVQINAISSPANGLMVYNTTLNKLCVYENGTWKQVTTTTM